ncbi:hypothetical protein NL676_013730 [Syzygium grande]|nr:hypothetical protein NL676_013730 [Syzygium grande]
METATNDAEAEKKAEFGASEIEYASYGGEHHLPLIMSLVDHEQELAKRFKLYRLWDYPSPRRFFETHSGSIRAVVGNTKVGADAELIRALPRLEMVATYSVGLFLELLIPLFPILLETPRFVHALAIT